MSARDRVIANVLPSTDWRYGARCVHCDRTISYHHRAYAMCRTARELRQGAALTYFKAQA